MEAGRFEGLDPSELETHRRWLQRLAVAILRDTDRAEDCVQEVFLTALRAGPDKRAVESSVRAWLKRVLVNRARKSIDLEARRRYHEGLALAERPRTSAREPLELDELQAELHRGVLALEPRYREVVLLRHEKGLGPTEIALHLGVPTKTVNSWMYRAYGRLRQRLDGRFEGFQAWAPLLLGGVEGLVRAPAAPAGAPPVSPAPPRTGALRWAAATTGVCVLAGALVFLEHPSRQARADVVAYAPPSAGAVEPAPTLVAGSGGSARAARAEIEPERASSAAAAVDTAPFAAIAAGPATWAGRVLDAEGAPVAGLRLRFEPLTEADVLLFSDRGSSGYEELLQRIGRSFEPQLEARAAPAPDGGATHSAADGTFALPLPERLGWIAVEGGAWSTLSTALALALPPTSDALVQVAPARRVAGRVLDQDGLPLESVRVELRLPARFLAAESGMPTRIAREPSVFTGEDGTFVLERAPGLSDALLRFSRNGYEPDERPLGACARSAARELEVTLLAEDPALVVAGRALDALGAPLAGVFLSFDWSTTALGDEHGRFRLRLPETHAAAGRRQSGTLRAAAQGFQPLQRALWSDGELWPEVELVFDAPALELRGVVLRADGTPHPNAAVWVPAPATLGLLPGNRPPIFTEHVMSGPQDGGSLEATITDAEGGFRLRGLQERSYVVRVADLETREWFESEPLQAGRDDLLLEFPTQGCYPEVRGVVVARDGTPITDALVARSYPRLDARLPDGRRYLSRFSGEPVGVDAGGRFVLHDVARRGGILTVLGPSTQTRHVELERESDPADLRLVLGRACRVVLERGGADFERFTFESGDGGRVEFATAVRGTGLPLSEARMTEERTVEYLVTDLAAELVLWKGTREVARRALALVPGELNVLRP